MRSSLSGDCVLSPAPPLNHGEFKVALSPCPAPIFSALPQGKSWTKPWGPPAMCWGSWERPEWRAGVLWENGVLPGVQHCTGAWCCSGSTLQHLGLLHRAHGPRAQFPAWGQLCGAGTNAGAAWGDSAGQRLAQLPQGSTLLSLQHRQPSPRGRPC